MKRPSFYTYFDSVDDLLDAMIRREIYRLEALYEAPKDKDKNKTALHRIAGIPMSIVTIALRDKALFVRQLYVLFCRPMPLSKLLVMLCHKKSSHSMDVGHRH